MRFTRAVEPLDSLSLMNIDSAAPRVRMPRRNFLRAGSMALAAPLLMRPGFDPVRAAGASSRNDSLQGRLYKTLKIGMVNLPGSLTDKFTVLKEVGFDGVEMDSPGMDVEATRRAIAESGLPVDGTVCSTHWNVRHSDPNPETRAKALADLQKAIRDTHAVGGHTVLLVVGHGNDGSEREVWDRSIANIRLALPLAAKLGIYIAVENVWNHFLYQHDGPDDQSAEPLRDYIDELNSPWVGVQFDIGNHQKYSKPAQWIHTLGRRIVKLDAKDWGVEAGWAKIGEGDVDWPAVRQALLDIGFSGWAAAEVAGGGRERLAEISRNMDRVFALR
jgi:L-ribulose-5-phosphate 3-epimerase